MKERNKINNGLEVQTEASSGGNSKAINADVVLVCIGRKPIYIDDEIGSIRQTSTIL